MAYFDFPLLLQRLTYYAGPAEIHITVSLENTEAEKARFQEACEIENGKSIWIELASGHNINQPMYGKKLFTSALKQADEISRLVDRFEENFLVKRVKVEAGPDNQNIPQKFDKAQTEPEDCYFEHHVALSLNPDIDFKLLKSQLAQYDGYLSNNAFKIEPASGQQIRFVTQRFSKIGQMEANAELDKLIAYAKQAGIEVIRVEREYNIYDSNLHLDNGWMS